MDLSTIAGGAVIFVLSAALAFSQVQKSGLKSELRDWRNVAAERDTITVIDSTAVTRQAIELENLTLDNKRLDDYIKELEGNVRSTTALLTEARIAIDRLETAVDTVEVDGVEVAVRSFEYSDPVFRLRGFYEPIAATVTIPELSANFDLDITIFKDGNHAWHSMVETSDARIKIRKLNTFLAPQKINFWDKLHSGVGVYGGNGLGGGIGYIGYDKYRFYGLLGSPGIAAGFTYEFH
tara:strand:- start:529 stop:1239 length:711 start_codon:yes stop_codon:yes gene_type:complete